MTCECNNKSSKVVDDIIASDKLIQAAIDDWTAHAGETSSTLTRPGKAEEIGSAVYVPGGGKSVGLIGGAVRVSPAGVPFLINDALHAEIGLTGVRIGALSHELIADYTHDFSKVGTLQAVADESLAAYMLQIGGSVERNYATFRLVAPLEFSAKGDGTITQIPPIWAPSLKLDAGNSNAAQGYLSFTTPLKPISANQPIVTAKTDAAWGSRAKVFTAYSTQTAIKIGAFSERLKGCRVRSNAGALVVEQNASGDITVTSSGNTITATHPAAKSGVGGRQIVAMKNPNIYTIDSFGSTTTLIKCFGPDGIAKSGTDASIDFLFSFDASSPPKDLEPFSANDEFTVFAGYYYLPVANLGAVAEGNIWLFGAMNK